MRGERAQVTMFFIIGLVLLFTFGIFYLLSGDEPAPAQQVGNEALNSYVRTCVDSLMEQELRTLGESGGIWPEENAQEYEYVTVDGEQVLVAITENMMRPGDEGILPYRAPPPDYPAVGLRIQDAGLIMTPDGPLEMYDFQDGYFGDTMLPALCRSCRNQIGIEMGGVSGTRGIEVSVEERLEQKVNESLRTCINQDIIRQYLGTEVERKSESVNLNFTNQAVLLNIRYVFLADGREQELTLSPRYSIRYQALMSFIQDLAREETRNVSFKMDGDYTRISSYRDGFTVERTNRFTESSPYHDIFRVEDSRSILAGKPYAVQFAVQHRPPMLNPITRMEECVASAGADPDDDRIAPAWDPETQTCAVTTPGFDGSDWQQLSR